jgi:hypothetical protein
VFKEDHAGDAVDDQDERGSTDEDTQQSEADQ